MDEAGDDPPPESEADGQTAQLEGLERDMDIVDSALAALDSDDLDGAEALAAELGRSAG